MAHVRRCNDAAVPAYVTRKGAQQSGTVLLKLNRFDLGCRVLTQSRDLDGRLAWLPALGGSTVPEVDADAYIRRAIERDPDIWVVEIEHLDGWHPFDGAEL